MIRWAIEARGLCGAASQLHIGFIIFSTHSKTKSKVSTHGGVPLSCVLCVCGVCTDRRQTTSQEAVNSSSDNKLTTVTRERVTRDSGRAACETTSA